MFSTSKDADVSAGIGESGPESGRGKSRDRGLR